MKQTLLERLRCPQSGQPLVLECADSVSMATPNTSIRATDEILEGWLVSQDGRHRYPIRNGIPRFVPESNYADSFSMQWNHFAKTQFDNHSGHPISAERLWKATNWTSAEMKDCWVLDVGCGSGRFAEIALSTGAQVVALDYSSAVDACYANLTHHPNLHVVQGDIYALPFAPESFPFVYSLGVLQHTPDVAHAFSALPPMIEEGGGATLRGLLRKVHQKLAATQVLAASLYQAHGQTTPVWPGDNRRAGVVTDQSHSWARAPRGQAAQASGAGG